MSTLGIINSDLTIRQNIESTLKMNFRNKELLFLVQEDEILEFIKYALPELIVINFSDPAIKIDKIIDQISDDKWILNFGIIGIFDITKDKEETLLEKYKGINVITMLDSFCIRSHLAKSIEIIEQNYQIIFQREFTKTFLQGVSGSFTLDNDLLSVPLYAGIGATIMSQRGLINSDSKMHLQLALIELIVNAIEHGNCNISYEEKSKTLETGITSAEMIAEKCKDPEIQAKKVFLGWEIKPNKSIFIIRDQGGGFDIKEYIKKMKTQDDFSLHGRGIKMAVKLSHNIKYNAKGNQVSLTMNHDTTFEYGVPAGFTKEEVIIVKEGDVIIKEGDPSDCLYYISSGTYDVIHNKICVGTLSPQDIFMGEMSFLLNQRRSATIKATSAGKLVLLPQKNFINIIREFPHYGIFLSKLLAKRLVRTNEQVATSH